LSHRICTGIPRRRLGKLVGGLAPVWLAQQESALRERRGGRDRLRAAGAGPNRDLPFADRMGQDRDLRLARPGRRPFWEFAPLASVWYCSTTLAGMRPRRRLAAEDRKPDMA
jgi:hypothetical protein